MLRDVNWNVDEIDLKGYDLRQLPVSPICPILVKLFLQVPRLTMIPPTFFEHMPVLEVLDLSNTNIVSLPTSISSLSLLQEFFLRDCPALMELPTHIGKLSKLKLFDIKGTELMFIPKEMGKLKDLQVLRVSLSHYAKDYIKANSLNETVIPRKMISELKQLKELRVTISVGPEPEWWEEDVKYLQKELCDLENLETLSWYLPTNELLQQFLLLERNHVPIYACLSNLTLTIGMHAQLTSCLPHGLEKKFQEFKNCLKWINAVGDVGDISKIMESVEALFLSRHWTIEKLSTFSFTNLKYCLLSECNEMETIIEADGSSKDVATRIKNGEKIGLELLQYLSIHHMKKLQSVWKGSIGKDSLSKLRILALHSCRKLPSIFTPTIAQNLSCLAELTVEDCPKVTSLISCESHDIKYGSFFPCLKNIFLLDLPKLANIFVGQILLENLRTMLIYSCLQLRVLPNMELPHIEKIEGETEWWKGLGHDKSQWDNIFVPLKKGRDLVEQLFEATNSLEHFHVSLSQEHDEMDWSKSTDIRDEVITADTSTEEGKRIFLRTDETEDNKSYERFHLEAPETTQLDRLSLSRQESGMKRKRILIEDNKVKGTLVLENNHSISTVAGDFLGKKVSLQLISAVRSEYTARGLRGKLGKETHLKKAEGESTFEVDFDWEDEIEVPGAFLVTNRHNKEFYLKTLTLTDVPEVGRIHFVCNSWVYPEKLYNTGYRVFFSNQAYLPGETPEGLLYYREEELGELRGNGTGKREEWDRVYDYDVYNDLSELDKGSELVRPIFGGSIDRPYPRRCRTGRPSSNSDPNMESRIGILQSLKIYVPRDERFSELKTSDVYAYGLKLVSQGLLPGFKAAWHKISDGILGMLENFLHHKFENKFNEFSSFEDVLKLYEGGVTIPKISFLESIREKIPSEFLGELLRSDGELLSKFPIPQVIKEDKSAWRTDEEFGRELLAGTCPVVIRRLQEFPPTSRLDPREFGNQNSWITEEHLKDHMDGFSVWEAMKHNRLFILDHHDPLMPCLRGINETSTKTYATRTILFLKNNGTLKPIAIELSLPHPDGDEAGAISTVHTPASEGAEGTIWLLAKAYASVNDSGYHQLVCHWLHTHATIEPFIIATHRQLSVLHPIHKLLHPHFRDTMNINALSRQTFINAGGLLEKTVFLDKYSLTMSCNMYKMWDFTKQALPVDLIDRGMAVEDSRCPHGVRLIIEDYPFAVDGLEIWSAIRSWVQDYVCIYYKNDEEVQKDGELKNWWEEVRTKGHGDLKNEPWWPKMHTREELIQSCTIIIWVASALHAAVNFGQYLYGGYLPNRPAMSRRLLPEPGTKDYDELETNPEKAFLKTVTPQLQSILGISLIEVLSRHSTDEVYLGERDTPEWTADQRALEAFDGFGAHLRKIEQKIEAMNLDEKLINRTGPAQMPYTLLYPSSDNGLTGRGIPNSVSI